VLGEVLRAVRPARTGSRVMGGGGGRAVFAAAFASFKPGKRRSEFRSDSVKVCETDRTPAEKGRIVQSEKTFNRSCAPTLTLQSGLPWGVRRHMGVVVVPQLTQPGTVSAAAGAAIEAGEGARKGSGSGGGAAWSEWMLGRRKPIGACRACSNAYADISSRCCTTRANSKFGVAAAQ
jgi:hypothetical protein